MCHREPPRGHLLPLVPGSEITLYLQRGGTLEHAQKIAGHADPRTTRLSDRTGDTVSLDEVERIVF